MFSSSACTVVTLLCYTLSVHVVCGARHQILSSSPPHRQAASTKEAEANHFHFHFQNEGNDKDPRLVEIKSTNKEEMEAVHQGMAYNTVLNNQRSLKSPSPCSNSPTDDDDDDHQPKVDPPPQTTSLSTSSDHVYQSLPATDTYDQLQHPELFSDYAKPRPHPPSHN